MSQTIRRLELELRDLQNQLVQLRELVRYIKSCEYPMATDAKYIANSHKEIYALTQHAQYIRSKLEELGVRQ